MNKFTGIEDWNKMSKDFKECMSNVNKYEEAIMPVATLARLKGTASEPPLPTDEKDKETCQEQLIAKHILCSSPMLDEVLLSEESLAG